MDYKETIKERVEMLSPELRAFVLDENWRREAEKIGKKFNLDEEKYASLENEIFLVLLCFEPTDDFVENIKNELGLDTNIAEFIKEDAEKNIFNKIPEEKEEVPEKSKEPQPQNNIGTSFEQIILNQAKAMMPARPAGWVPPDRSMNYESRIMNEKEGKPANLPTESSEPKAIHNYITEPDPYREPLE